MVAKVANWATFETAGDCKIGARDMSPAVGRLLISLATTLGDLFCGHTHYWTVEKCVICISCSLDGHASMLRNSCSSSLLALQLKL